MDKDKVMENSYDVDNIFTYHKPNMNSQKRYGEIRGMAKEFATLIIHACPDTRERTTALSRLEEVVMWANASVARHLTE